MLILMHKNIYQQICECRDREGRIILMAIELHESRISRISLATLLSIVSTWLELTLYQLAILLNLLFLFRCQESLSLSTTAHTSNYLLIRYDSCDQINAEHAPRIVWHHCCAGQYQGAWLTLGLATLCSAGIQPLLYVKSMIRLFSAGCSLPLDCIRQGHKSQPLVPANLF